MGKNIIVIFATCLVLVFGEAQGVFANGGLSASYETTPLFSSADGPWYPGRTLSKWIDVTNNSSESQNIGFKAEKTGDGTLDQKMPVQIIKDSLSGDVVYGSSLKHLSDLFSASEVQIDTLAAGQSRRYYLKISMEDIGNEYQDQGFGADFTVGFLGTSPETPTVPSTPSGPGTILTPLGVIGGGISRFVASVLETPVEEAKPEEVKGEEKEKEEDKGVEGETSEREKKCFWWWILLIVQAVILSGYYFFLHREGIRNRRWWIIPVVISLLIYILHWFLAKPYTPTVYCDWYWALVLIVLFGTTDIYLYFRNRQKEC